MANLKDFIKENEEHLKKLCFDEQHNINAHKELTEKNVINLHSSALSSIGKQLLKLEEFEFVERINYVNVPAFLVDSDTGVPVNVNVKHNVVKNSITDDHGTTTTTISLEIAEDSIPLGTKPVHTETYRLGEQPFKFNKEIDIYAINFIKTYKLGSKLEKGVWIFPTQYDSETFEPRDEIKVIFSQEEMTRIAYDHITSKNKAYLQKELNDEVIKQVRESIIAKFAETLNKGRVNIPYEYEIRIRCSSRSVLAS